MVTKEQIEAVAKEFIYDLPGVSQRDADNTAEKVAFNIYRLIKKQTEKKETKN